MRNIARYGKHQSVALVSVTTTPFWHSVVPRTPVARVHNLLLLCSRRGNYCERQSALLVIALTPVRTGVLSYHTTLVAETQEYTTGQHGRPSRALMQEMQCWQHASDRYKYMLRHRSLSFPASSTASRWRLGPLVLPSTCKASFPRQCVNTPQIRSEQDRTWFRVLPVS